MHYFNVWQSSAPTRPLTHLWTCCNEKWLHFLRILFFHPFLTCIILTARPIRTCVLKLVVGITRPTRKSQLLQQSMWCSNSSHLLFYFLPFLSAPTAFYFSIIINECSLLFSLIFHPTGCTKNEYTRCHSTLKYTEDTGSQPDVHSSTQHMQWLLFPFTVAAPLHGYCYLNTILRITHTYQQQLVLCAVSDRKE